ADVEERVGVRDLARRLGGGARHHGGEGAEEREDERDPEELKAMWATATRLASALAPIDAVSAVTQVPTFAPSTTATAPRRLSSPWWAKASARARVAADDGTSALNAAPTRTPGTGLPAIASRRTT